MTEPEMTAAETPASSQSPGVPPALVEAAAAQTEQPKNAEAELALQELAEVAGAALEKHPLIRSAAIMVDWELPGAASATLPVGVWRVSNKEVTSFKAVEMIKQLARMMNHLSRVTYRMVSMSAQFNPHDPAAVVGYFAGLRKAGRTKEELLSLVDGAFKDA
jgi:hypothetical protein